MANSKEYEMAIKIAGKIEQSFYNTTKLTKKELAQIAKSAAESSTSANDYIAKGLKDAQPAFDGLENKAKATFKAVATAAAVVGTAIVAGIGMAIPAGAEFESAFAGVKKTVNATDEELAQMRDEIRQMSKEMPKSAAGLSEIAEEAGQLGIQTENITGFTKTMADLEVATNLTSDEGAAQFAKFANITGMAQNNFGRLGSSVVALGNNMATTEADIVSMGMRIAAAGDQVGLSQAQIMGYSAALSSVGIEAEAGGSAFSKLLVNLQMATETGKGLKSYSQVAGMTGKQFKEAFQKDAAGAINAFLSGLKDTERNGKSAIAVLDDMGLTEVRLRDTLLRAANASDMFGNALKTSENAWEENIALSNEAAQRYETFDSQCDILKNKITDVGITVYDASKQAMTEVMGLANNFVDGIAGQEGAIKSMLGGISKGVPTIAREVRGAGKAIKEFSEPFLKVGGWLIANPGIIVGAIVGIGTALATYKIASGIMSIASALGSLGPVGAGILAIGGVAAVIAGIGTAVKKNAEEAKKANLAKHFGNISLSLKDLEEIASFVVSSESLDKVRESLAAFDELDGISESIQTATDAINKSNWKVSIGMELTDDEKQDYQSQIQAFIRATQEYVTQEQYAATLSINAFVDDGSDAVAQLNEFYSSKQAELAAIGQELSNVVTEAFNDGLLEVDEAEKIAELQRQMAHMQASFAEGEFQSGLDLVAMKYEGVMPDSESFINMQDEIRQYADDAIASYDEAYVKESKIFHGIMNDENSTQEERNRAQKNLEELQSGYMGEKADIQTQAVQFQVDMIKGAYGGEVDTLVEQVQEAAKTQATNYINDVVNGASVDSVEYLTQGIEKRMRASADNSSIDAMKELSEQLIPQLEQLQLLAKQFEDAGKSVPESIQKEIKDITAIAAIGGDTDALWAMVSEATNSEEFKKTIDSMRNAGVEIDGELGQSIQENASVVDSAIKTLYDKVQTSATRIFQQPIDININANVTEGGNVGGKNKKVDIKHADGGIFTVPHVAWFAEAGPEAAIPLDGSQNAISLWEKTGELLGMDGLSGGQEPVTADVEYVASVAPAQSSQISYSPVINFYGDSPSKGDMESAMETSQEKFSRMMERWQKDNGRLNFA